jgi:HSP20 family protein
MADTVNVPVQEQHSRAEPPESYFVPATDIFETGDELVLVADLPGVKAADLEVTLEDNVLVIRGAPHAEAKPRGEVLLQEFAAGEFYRAFQLPADYDTARIQAALKQGVLTLRLPKSERLKPRRIEVKVE